MTAPDSVVTVREGAEAQALKAAPATGYASARRLLIFGTGFGIAIGVKDLEIALVRSRAGGPSLPASTLIRDFRTRPAAEWGSEVSKFLEGAHEGRLAATVLIPRDEVIVRVVHLPGVADKDVPAALELQIDSLHPFGDEPVVWASMPVGRGSYAIGLIREDVLKSWELLFSEAGLPVAAFTFSSAVLHAALKIWRSGPPSFLLYFVDERGQTEIYGESEARPFYSSAFTMGPDRALGRSRAELRLPPDYTPQLLGESLPSLAGGKRAEFPSSGSALAFAAAVAASAPLAARFANLLPKARRASSARRQYLLPAILGSFLLFCLLGAFVVYPALEQRSYSAALEAEVHRLEPRAQYAQSLEKRARDNRAKTLALDEIRQRPQADLNVLNELTRLLPPQVWTNSIEIFPDSVVVSGEADQAAPLLKLLDSSPLFQNSEFALGVTHSGQNEQFRIKTMRRGRSGRTTP